MELITIEYILSRMSERIKESVNVSFDIIFVRIVLKVDSKRAAINQLAGDQTSKRMNEQFNRVNIEQAIE